MAHLDLEEQEQLDQFKQFWKQYGNLITWALLLAVVLFAGWTGWQYWQNRQAGEASAFYEEVERIAMAGDATRMDRALSDMKERFSGTVQAQRAGLLVAAVHAAAGRPDAARTALQAVTEQGADEGLRAVARLRLAGLLLDAKSYDDALKALSADFPPAFVALAADRRGDVYLAQGKKAEATEQYRQAAKGLDAANNYRTVVDGKLAALGVAVEPAGAAK
jgi:predicted negative regulator of RcsB-dependent stress response